MRGRAPDWSAPAGLESRTRIVPIRNPQCPALSRGATRRSAQRKPPLTVDALWAIRRIGTPTISPDGALACSAVTRFDMEKNEGSTSLWLFPTGLGGRATAGRARMLTAGDKDSDPKWSPDGKWIAFTAKRKDDEEPQLYVIAPDGGEAKRLTRLATGCAAPKWFADGTRIAFVSWVWPDLATDALQAKRRKERKDEKVKAHVTERSEFRFWDHWLADGREPHVYVCDVATGRCRDVLAGTGLALPPWDPSAEHFDIAPDGRELAITADLAPEPQMMNQTDIVAVDLATRRKRVLTARTNTSDAHPRYSPDGRALVFEAYDTKRAFNDQGHLVLFARTSGAMRRLAPRLDRAVTHVAWTPDSRALLFTLEDRGRVGICAAGARAPPAPAWIAPGGTIGGFAQSRDGAVLAFDRAIVDASAGAVRVPRRRRRRAIDREPQPGAPRAARAGRGARGDGHAAGAARPVQMWITYPPNFDPTRKWPLLHSIHGGPHAAHHDGWHFRWNTQVFAGHGYVVAAVNYHGSSGFGQKWLETITGRYGEKEFADVEAGTDWLLRQGYIDRVAAGRDRRQLRRLHGRVHERTHRPLPRVRLPRRLLRLGQHDGDRRLPLLRRRARAPSTGTIRRA